VPYWAGTGVVYRLYVNFTDPLDGGHCSVEYLESIESLENAPFYLL
jgi:hypothetical protein